MRSSVFNSSPLCTLFLATITASLETNSICWMMYDIDLHPLFSWWSQWDVVVAGHCPSCWTWEVNEHACDFCCCSNWSFLKKICCCCLGLYFPLFLFCCQIWNLYTFVVRSSQLSIQVDLNSKYRKSYQYMRRYMYSFSLPKGKMMNDKIPPAHLCSWQVLSSWSPLCFQMFCVKLQSVYRQVFLNHILQFDFSNLAHNVES